MDAREAYLRTNRALGDVFFDGRFAGQPVYLSLDNEMREELALALDVAEPEVEDYVCKVVKHLLLFKGNPYAPIDREMKEWRREKSNDVPPCLALLFCLSHAATIMVSEGNFASNNYYLRLAQLTGVSRKVLQQYRQSPEPYWDALSDWLLGNNYALGRPTARSSATWRYVGKAMSQAIVRAADRPYFHDLYRRFGFKGSEELSASEMEQYLAHWMPSAGSSPRLKNIWKKKELRERLAEAAIAELAAWSVRASTSDGGSQVRVASLSLMAALIPNFPNTLLRLNLGRLGEGDPQVAYHQDSTGGDFVLSNEVSGAVATITPPVVAAQGMGHALRFERTDGDVVSRLEWQPRLVIPLAIHPQANQWMEVTRAKFGIEHIVLVRNAKGLPSKVERYLEEACEEQPSKADQDDLVGLPNGWVLYTGVILRNEASAERGDVDCLVPLTNDGALVVEAGLELAHGFYHRSFKPSVAIIAPTGPTSLEVHRVPSVESEAPLASVASDSGTCGLALGSIEDDGALGVSLLARQEDKLLLDREMFFRDADTPQPLHQANKGWLHYHSLITASGDQEIEGVLVEGMRTRGEVPELQNLEESGDYELLGGSEESLQDATTIVTKLRTHVAQQTCVERGYHHMLLPPVRRNAPAGLVVEGECKDCGRLDTFVRQTARSKRDPAVKRPPLPRFKQRAEVDEKPVDQDGFFDALCFLGRGSWGKLLSVAEFWNEAAIHPRELARRLFLLGHLDLEIRPGTNAIKSWCVPPPTVNFVDTASAYLSGFRCSCLLSKIEERIAPLNGQLKREEVTGQPARISIECVMPASAREVLDTLEDPLGRSVVVNENAAFNMARACFAMGDLFGQLAPVSVGKSKDLQRFDFSKMKWIEVESAISPGAYRWNHGIQVYAFKDDSGRAVAGPYQLIKLLAARRECLQLHKYLSSKQVFLSTLGCEPPGLLERALVAATGKIPTISHGIVSYPDINQDVASAILSIMYEDNRANHEATASYQRI